jgi:putative ABC transport system permease protein
MKRRRRLAAKFPIAVLARRNISRAPDRSTLAVVAVVIGVVAIGTVGIGGEAFKQDQLEAYDGFSGTATVSPVFYPDDGDPADQTFSTEDVDRMRQATSGATVLPLVEPSDALVRTPSGEALVTAQVKGMSNPGEFYDARDGAIPDNWRRSVVVGSRIAANNDIQPGDRMTVVVEGEFEQSFRVAAVLEPQGFADQLSADRSVFVPLTQFDDSRYDRALVTVNPQTGSIDDAAERIEAEFNARQRTVHVSEVQEQREQFKQTFGTINQFLIGVGSISLLVAAVTIANTMLMSAIERETEIGVMRAVGYPKRVVVRLIVTEAGILGATGAVVGVPLVFGIGMVSNQVLVGDPLAFTTTGLQHVAIGAVLGIGISVLAGIYPAWKAANKRPVEVLN